MKSSTKSILLTGGIGDVFTLEPYFSALPDLEEIVWASRTSTPMIPLLQKTHPHIKQTDLVQDPAIWSRLWAFFSRESIVDRLPDFDTTWTRSALRDRLADVADWSIMIRFPEVSGLQYIPSTILTHNLADITGFDLPDRFAFCQPYTPANKPNQRRIRDYRPEDWDFARRWLDKRNLVGVVINQGDDEIPDDFVDLSNRTTLCEAIEVLKQAEGYCGIDSCFACLACQLFDKDHLNVMWRNTHYWSQKHIYCRPHKTFEFLRCGS